MHREMVSRAIASPASTVIIDWLVIFFSFATFLPGNVARKDDFPHLPRRKLQVSFASLICDNSVSLMCIFIIVIFRTSTFYSYDVFKFAPEREDMRSSEQNK